MDFPLALGALDPRASNGRQYTNELLCGENTGDPADLSVANSIPFAQCRLPSA